MRESSLTHLLLICSQSGFRDDHQKRIADFEGCVNGRNPRRPVYVASRRRRGTQVRFGPSSETPRCDNYSLLSGSSKGPGGAELGEGADLAASVSNQTLGTPGQLRKPLKCLT